MEMVKKKLTKLCLSVSRNYVKFSYSINTTIIVLVIKVKIKDQASTRFLFEEIEKLQ